ncbi:prolyl 4-hydroxylase subunit alpha-1-like [Drosophila ficusphila]|uniref:prolyl 4-hydroxylase subunit alpha-1-like n=1 Tax=Drosophila ficusphila TaxID=30025 RepID=UPI0007E6B7FD|nr:prolyl 4-hydroxylase subunit alpha-1-like [Drosophila ficusphila]
MKTSLAFLVFSVTAFFSPLRAQASSKVKDGGPLPMFKLKNLLWLNLDLMNDLENYIKALDAKMKIIKEALFDMSSYHIKYEHAKESIIDSPVGSFSLIHHMQSDWTHWLVFLQEETGQDEMDSLLSKIRYLPTEQDVSSACQGISRITNAYDLSPEKISRGSFLGVQSKSLLSPRDFLQLADYSMANKDFEKSEQWLQVAISLLENPSYQKRILPLFRLNVVDLYLKLSEVYVKKQMWPRALEIVETALKFQTRNAALLQMQEHLSYQILLNPPSNATHNLRNGKHPLRRNGSLHCFYQHRGGFPSLFSTTLKAEILLVDPLTVFYHETPK